MTEPRGAAGDPLRGGAAARVGRLFERHGRTVYGLCRLMLRDAGEAEDAAQQTFLSAHRALLAGVNPRDDAAWLTAIARNECRSRLRARRDAPLPLLDGIAARAASSHETVALAAEVDELKAALRDLPEKQREAVLLRDLFGLRYSEIAVVLGSSRPAVEALLFRARRQIRGRLRPLRDVAAGIAVPASLRDALELAIPGLGASGTTAGAVAAGAGLAKVSAPAAAKVAAAALAVGAAGTVGVAEVGQMGPDPVARPLAAPTTTAAPDAPEPAPVTHVQRELRAEPVVTRVARVPKPARRASARVDNSGPGNAHEAVRRDDDNSGPGGGDEDDERTPVREEPPRDDADDNSNSGRREGSAAVTEIETDNSGPGGGDDDGTDDDSSDDDSDDD